MNKWICSVCGYVHEGDSPPDRCPMCGAPRELFVRFNQPAAGGTIKKMATAGSADVLVVGSGAAAFAAAVTARKNGASVIMLEKAGSVGGTTSRSGGGFWIPLNMWQKAAGYQDSREDALRYMARYSYPHLFNPDARLCGIPQREFELMESYVDNGYKMVSAFEKWGALRSAMEVNWKGHGQVDYQDHLPENKGIRGRSIYPRGKDGKVKTSGSELIKQMEAWARAEGVEILTGAEVKTILRDRGGRVYGLETRTNGAERIILAAKGVIFGSGGYSHNAEYMLQFQRGPHFGGCAVPTNTGDFMRMGGAAGARIGNAPGAFRAQSIIEEWLKNPGGSSNVFYLPGDSMILVNKYGKRVVNEKRNYNDRAMAHFAWDATRAEWTNMLTFMLFDSRTAKLWQGFPPFPAYGQEIPYIIKALSLEELERRLSDRLAGLAPHTGGFSLHPEFLPNLKKTAERFNKFAANGTDEDFHRGETAYDQEWTTFPPSIAGEKWPPEDSKNPTMFPISDTGPYYAIILAAGTLDTNGGPVIDKNAQVLDWNDNPIPGLYGAGNCVASPAANAYWGAGSTIGPGLTFGYIAGNHIMK